MIDLKAIRAAAEAATPGPWHFGTFHKLLITDADNSKHFPIAQIEGSELPWDSTEESKRAYNNADHIATANPATVIALCDEIERLTACLKKANDQAEHFEREWYLRGDKLEAAEKDAARYRFIRKPAMSQREVMLVANAILCFSEEELDDHIDAAMKDEQK